MENICLNCGTRYTGHFCTHCGQKAHTRRITFATILHDIPHSVFHIDKGFFFTLKQLAIRPGKAIKEYLDGKRVRHFSPLAYLLLLCTVSTFISHTIKGEAHPGPGILFPRAAAFFYNYPALMFCAFIPFMSFWSWLFNRQSGYNYWENVILNTYLVAQFNIVIIFQILYTILTGVWLGKVTYMLILFFTYFGFAYWQFFGRLHSAVQAVMRITMYLAIVLTLITGLTLAGFMTPWWYFKN